MYISTYLCGRKTKVMISVKPYKSVRQLLDAFPTEQHCIDHLELLRWRGQVVSPFDKESKVYKCADNKYRCVNTKKYFTVKTNSIFEGSKVSFRDWFVSIYLFVVSKRGISSYQLADELDVTQKTAWFILSRLRFAIEPEQDEFDGDIESDESFVGGKNKNRHKYKKVEQSQGRSFKDKTPVLGLIQRGQYEIVRRPHKIIDGEYVNEKVCIQAPKVKTFVIADTKTKTIQPLVLSNVKEGSRLLTDEWMAYQGLNKHYTHQFVDHGRGQYAEGDVTTNRIENYWSHLKRSIIGVYYKVSRKHLQLYLNERSFRFNNRMSVLSEKIDLFLQDINGKRLTYQTLVYGSEINKRS